MNKGTVKWYSIRKGYGFIQPGDGSKDVFVHVSALERSGIRTLSEGQRVTFELQGQDLGGRPEARGIRFPTNRARQQPTELAACICKRPHFFCRITETYRS
jgi:CspA family cold shock protein